jgi:hypothetical protein
VFSPNTAFHYFIFFQYFIVQSNGFHYDIFKYVGNILWSYWPPSFSPASSYITGPPICRPFCFTCMYCFFLNI